MQSPLHIQEVQYFSKLRRSDSTDGGLSIDRNIIKLVLKNEDKEKEEKKKYKGKEQQKEEKEERKEEEKGKREIKNREQKENMMINNNKLNLDEKQKEEIVSDNYEENYITFNLIKNITVYGINLHIDIFILKNSNIIFFAQNLINIYNPIIKRLKTIFTKQDYLITSAALTGKTVVLVFYGLSKHSCIQLYDIENHILQEEIEMQDFSYYEKIFVYQKKNYYILITNKQALKIFDTDKKKFIFTIYRHKEYTNIYQYFDHLIVSRDNKLYLWTLEETYTGLKLQETEMISNNKFYIKCFCIYERNIFIVNSEGNVFLWKDCFTQMIIKNGMVRNRFHKTPIDFIHFYENRLLTKGRDEIRIWECKFQKKENTKDDIEIVAKMVEEVQITSFPIHINKIISHEHFHIIVDKINWNLYWLNTKNKNKDKDFFMCIFYNDHNGKIKDLFCYEQNIFSFGLNGQIYNYYKQKDTERNMCLYKFQDSITYSKYIYKVKDFLFFCLGFINGLVKIVKLKHLYLDVIYCVKVGNEKIIKIEKNENANLLAIISENQSRVFFLFKYKNEYQPLGYLEIKDTLITNCFYLSGLDSFYIVGDDNCLFQIRSTNLYEECERIKKRYNLEYDKNNKMEKEKENKNKNEKEKENENENKNEKENENEDENFYDIYVSYEIIQIQFDKSNEIPRRSGIEESTIMEWNKLEKTKKKRNKKNKENKEKSVTDTETEIEIETEIETHEKENQQGKKKRKDEKDKEKEKDKEGEHETSNTYEEHEEHEEHEEQEEHLGNDLKYDERNDVFSTDDTSGSDLSEECCQKINFYRDKMKLLNNKIIDIESQKRNLKKCVEIIFNKKILRKLEKKKTSYPFLCKKIGFNKKQEKENERNEFKNIKTASINISCIAKINENGILISTTGSKSNCLFYLNLKLKQKYKNGNENENENILIATPIILSEIDKTIFPTDHFFRKMIINHSNSTLFCLTNYNTIFVFSIKLHFAYYYFKIPFHEKVQNFYINKETKNNEQYIFVYLHNTYMRFTFSYSIFFFYNLIKKYRLHWYLFTNIFTNIQTINYESIYNIFVKQLYNYITEHFGKKGSKKKKLNNIPFSFQDIQIDIEWFLQLFQKEFYGKEITKLIEIKEMKEIKDMKKEDKQKQEVGLQLTKKTKEKKIIDIDVNGDESGDKDEDVNKNGDENADIDVQVDVDAKGDVNIKRSMIAQVDVNTNIDAAVVSVAVLDIHSVIDTDANIKEKKKIADKDFINLWENKKNEIHNLTDAEIEIEKERKREERNELIQLLYTYDQNNMNIYFNLEKHVNDENILYNLREMKQAKRNEEKVKRAIIYRKKMYKKIKKLNKKYKKLNKKKRFLIDVEYSYNIYKNLKKKIEQVKQIFQNSQIEYDKKIKYLSNQYLKLKFSNNSIQSFEKQLQIKQLKTYLKNRKGLEKKNKKREKKKIKKIKKPINVKEINKQIKLLEILKLRNNKVGTINDEAKIEEISQKKKIIKMYEEIIQKLETLGSQQKGNHTPKKITHITEIIKKHEENKRKLINQINFIKEVFNADFEFLKVNITERLCHLREEVFFLKEMLKEERISNTVTEKEKTNEKDHNKNVWEEQESFQVVEKNQLCKNILEKIERLILQNESSTKMVNKLLESSFFEQKYQKYNKEIIIQKIKKLIKSFNKDIYLLHMKKIQAIKLIKYISLKINSINEKNNILLELRKKELKLKKQKKKYVKEMKYIEQDINKLEEQITIFTEQLGSQNKIREKIYEQLKVLVGDNSLYYDMLLKDIKQSQYEEQEQLSNCSDADSDKSEKIDTRGNITETERNKPIIDVCNKEKVESLKAENFTTSKIIMNIKKSIDNKKNEHKKLIMKKKYIEKEIEQINDEISIIEDDKKNNISAIKFYITLKISKLKNVDYIYDKKQYRLTMADKCVTLSVEQYRDIMKKTEKDLKKKEHFLSRYKNLKKKNEELEKINKQLAEQVTNKEVSLKNKLKKYDLRFDFNDLEKKFLEKKKNAVLEADIRNMETEYNQKMDSLNKEMKKKTYDLSNVKKKNTLLLEKIKECINVLKEIKNDEKQKEKEKETEKVQS